MVEGPILVTGAGGCIGAWVTANLTERGIPMVAFDASDNRRRLRLVMDDEAVNEVIWVASDVADLGELCRLVERHRVKAIVHLAALQIPFCKADPFNGARVNVLGTVAVFETARRYGIAHLVYASSVAAAGADGPPSTLYGVYKAADEGIARIYWQDWQVPSIGLRPHTVYGPGRDQGLTSAPTVAMLAAVTKRPFTIPFRGALQMQYAGEVADAFVRAALAEPSGAGVFDLCGSVTTVESVVGIIRGLLPHSDIHIEGGALPVPASFSDEALGRRIGGWERVDLEDGIGRCIDRFGTLVGRGLVEMPS